jgi:hypothetical protein
VAPCPWDFLRFPRGLSALSSGDLIHEATLVGLLGVRGLVVKLGIKAEVPVSSQHPGLDDAIREDRENM